MVREARYLKNMVKVYQDRQRNIGYGKQLSAFTIKDYQ